MRKFSTVILVSLIAIATIPLRTDAQAHPISYVNRAEAAMILLKNAGVNVDIGVRSQGKYPDVIDGQWYVPYIMKGIELGILDVAETGFVFPHRSVSRGEFLTMISAAFNLSTGLPYQYTDIDPDSDHAKYAGLAWRYTLFDLSNPIELRPDLRISHVHAAKAVYTLLKAEPSLQKEGGLLPNKIVPTKVVSMTPTLIPLYPSAGPDNEETEQQEPNIFLSLSTPLSIKNATLKLLTSRKNLASQTRNELIAAINDFRASYNLGPLRSNYYLELSGQRHAKDMAERGYFSHYTPEGLSYIDRIRSAGYLDVQPDSCSCSESFDLSSADKGPNFLITSNEECRCEPTFSLGENLAKGQLTVKQVMDDWIASPTHRENMLRPEYDEIGIGLYEDLWVQQFGRLQFR